MNDSPLFSVLIANYNNGRFLMEAIDSVRKQTYSNWEIILVDDASTDNSIELYEQLKQDERIRVFYNGINRGCGFTKRRCAEMANGEICGFLDPDDTLLPDALQKHVVAHLDHPQVSVVYSRCYYCDSSGRIIGKNRLLNLKAGETYFDYRWYGAMHLASYKNEFYQKTDGISSNIKAGVDQDLYFKIEEVGEVYVLNEFTYKYYHRNENAITSNEGKLWYWNMEVRKAACQRRNLDVDSIISNDWQSLIKRIKKDSAFEKEKEVRSSLPYRIGLFLLRPFKWFKKLA